MTVLYKLSKEQLSKQYHYDFGLRALKSVLVMAGGLKRQYSDMPEDLVLMRALRDSNMPKFVFEDVPLFKGLINDLFPNMDCPRVGYEDLKTEVRKELETKGFRCSDDQVFADQVRNAFVAHFLCTSCAHFLYIACLLQGSTNYLFEQAYFRLPTAQSRLVVHYESRRGQKCELDRV